MEVIDHLTALETAGLIRVAQVTPDLEYLFRHALVQDAVYASLLEEDQQRLHLEVGEALEALYTDHLDDLAATLANHFEKAGDFERAFLYYSRAAAKSLAAFANQEAASQFRSAIELTQDPALQATLLSGLGEALFQQSRYEEAIQTWQEGIDHYHQLSNSDHIARLYARSARAAWFIDQPRGLSICNEGLAAVENASESTGLAMLVHEAARAHYFNGFPTEAIQLCRQALAMAERLENIEVRADALATLGILQDTPPEEALLALEQATALAEANGLLNIASRARMNLGTLTKGIRGDFIAARIHFLRSAELSHRRGAIQEEFIAWVGAGDISLFLGEFQEAETILKTLETLQELLPDSASARLQWQNVQAALWNMRGDFSKAIPVLRSGMVEARQRGDLQNLVGCIDGFVEAHFLLDRFQSIADWGEVEAALASALEVSERGILDKAYIYALHSTLKARQKKFSEAQEWLLEARQAAVEKPNIFFDVLIDQTGIELAMAEMRWDDALRGFDALAVRKSRLSFFYSGWMGVLWAEALMSRGEPADLEQTQIHLQEAQAVFEKLDSTPYQSLVKERIQHSRELTYALAMAQEKVSEELAQAGLLQESFLPERPPDLPGWQIAALLKPARAMSGDFYDFIPLPGGKLGMVIADVTDKGMGAALFMTSSRTLLRAYAVEYPEQPDQVLREVNRQITQNTRGGLYVTLFYGILDPAEKRIFYCNAGHNPPYLFRSSDDVEELPGTGIPLGVFESSSWGMGKVQFNPGSALVLYTDGVTEAHDQQENIYGSQRLFQVVKGAAFTPQRSAQGIQDAILQDLNRFAQGVSQSDDISLVVITCEA
jgi:serine phosphatase RsbU (regulator of sigma subunit)